MYTTSARFLQEMYGSWTAEYNSPFLRKKNIVRFEMFGRHFVVARITSKIVSGITSKIQCFIPANEHDLAIDVIAILQLDVIP